MAGGVSAGTRLSALLVVGNFFWPSFGLRQVRIGRRHDLLQAPGDTGQQLFPELPSSRVLAVGLCVRETRRVASCHQETSSSSTAGGWLGCRCCW